MDETVPWPAESTRFICEILSMIGRNSSDVAVLLAGNWPVRPSNVARLLYMSTTTGLEPPTAQTLKLFLHKCSPHILRQFLARSTSHVRLLDGTLPITVRMDPDAVQVEFEPLRRSLVFPAHALDRSGQSARDERGMIGHLVDALETVASNTLTCVQCGRRSLRIDGANCSNGHHRCRSCLEQQSPANGAGNDSAPGQPRKVVTCCSACGVQYDEEEMLSIFSARKFETFLHQVDTMASRMDQMTRCRIRFNRTPASTEGTLPYASFPSSAQILSVVYVSVKPNTPAASSHSAEDAACHFAPYVKSTSPHR